MDIIQKIDNHELLMLDGSMGALLLSKGIKATKLLSAGIENSDILIEIHKDYLSAGCDIIATNTFNITNETLKASSYSCEELVGANVKCAKKAKDSFPECAIALDIGPSGFFPRSDGTFPYEKAEDLFSKQIEAAGDDIDLILLETTSVVEDVEAVVSAAKKITDKPVMASMTFTSKCKTWYGVSLDLWIDKLNTLPLLSAGINCSLTPEEMLPLAVTMKKRASKPIFIEPNRGNPTYKDGEMIYEISAERFAEGLKSLYDENIRIIGGCCGSDPECMRKFKEMI